MARDDDLDDILALVRDYYDGMVEGSTQLLEKAFAPEARFSGVRDGELVDRDLAAFIGMTRAGTGSLSGMETETPNKHLQVEMVDVTGDIGVVKLRDDFRGRTYTDYLTLRKQSGAWRIVHKAFLARS